MTWFKVDDGFWSHPKTACLSDAAVALWLRAGAYCCQHLTDGVVKAPALRLLGGKASAQDLVDVGLWHELEDGWEFHDWADYQETSETVKKRRDSARERQRRSREIREEKRRESQGLSQRDSRVTHGVSSQEVFNPRPDPTRPDLIKIEKSDGRKRPDRKRSTTPLPETWQPNDAHRSKANTRGIDCTHEAEQFRSWALGKDERKANWDQAFHNWLGNARPTLRSINSGQDATTGRLWQE